MTEAEFARALLDPSAPVPPGLVAPGPLGPRPTDCRAADSDPADLADSGQRAVGKRFGVYRNNVAVALIDALAQTFPAVRHLVGAAFFDAMAREHYRAHPPRSPVMARYGAAFPDFIAGFPAARDLPYLADVARLELALVRAYHAADATPLAPERLARIDAGALTAAHVMLAPAVGLLRSGWPVLTIWRAAATGPAAPIDWRGEDVLVTRPGFDPLAEALAPGGHAFLAALLSGAAIGAAAEAARADAAASGAPFDLTALFAQLLAGGCIIGLSTSAA